MINNYLIVLSAHIDSISKKNQLLQTLEHLNKNNIDVCLSLHSNQFLDELSKYCKFVIYDKNNEFLVLQDYLDCAHLIDNPHQYGFPNGTFTTSHFKTKMSFPGSPHSKSALMLLRNGTIISYFNDYKWTIYLEYDLSIPEIGFKNFFNFHINFLEENQKKCFYYHTIFDNFDFLWGGFFVFRTEDVFNNTKFTYNNWYLNKENWIKEWYLGFFESIIQDTFHNSFSKEDIITDIIQEKFKNFWNTSTVSQISNFTYEQNYYTDNKYIRKVFELHLYPEIIEDKIKLHLLCNNRGDQTIQINKLIVYSKHQLYYSMDSTTTLPYNWFIKPIDITNIGSNETITLEWCAKTENEQYCNVETIHISNIRDVHNKICQIKFL